MGVIGRLKGIEKLRFIKEFDISSMVEYICRPHRKFVEKGNNKLMILLLFQIITLELTR